MSASAFGPGAILPLGRRPAAPRFTARDRHDLERWASEGRRVVISEGDPTAIAMLYEGAAPWASWAMARQDGLLAVWDCVTFADIGHFACMMDALAAISGGGARVADCNVVSFAAARLRRWSGDGRPR